MKHLVVLLCLLSLTGCIQENNPRNLKMGDVSLGQQLIDLKTALDSDAISDSEYEDMKLGLVNAASMCAESDSGEDSWFF